MKSASFTLFLPSYNGGEYLKECVRSVLAQSYRDFELVVLDDCSSDGSLQWLATIDDTPPHSLSFLAAFWHRKELGSYSGAPEA
jgi:glycosyltransferase involved in cell wall biosynthesis